MSSNNKVIWSEGMFLRPVHFQQHMRYVEDLVQARAGATDNHAWGFSVLRLDEQLLTLGKLAIVEARGVFPDGTPFNIPSQDAPPGALSIPADARDMVAYLALPLRRHGMHEVARQDAGDGLERYSPRETEIRDANAGSTSVAQVEIGQLSLKLLLERDKHDEYGCIGVARVVEMRDDQNVILDDTYIATVLDCATVHTLAGFANEVQGLLHHRGDALSARVSASGRGGVAELADFLMLQVVNRYEPLVAHLRTQGRLHPETLFRLLVELAGELATFTSANKRPAEFPPYKHHDLQATFTPVVAELRRSLSMVLEQNAIPIPLEERQYGIRVAAITDRGLLKNSTFVLSVNADMSTEDIRQRFPTHIKIGPVEQIRQLVNVQLPGIAVRPLPVAPRQLPYQANCVYFELDRASDYWAQLDTSGGFALHLSGEFPGIKMEFWAIKA